MKTKIIAMYLPQFHQILENDEFWGKEFTDWVTVKNANPLFKGHDQPKVPLNNNYYDLSIKENVKWQAELARKYGVYGFGIYHYWFNNEKNILTKPAEIILDNKDIDINYFYCWDNGSWVRSWSNVAGNDWAPLQEKKSSASKKGPAVLIPYILGNESDWLNHFNYLLPFFNDKRYIKIDGKPIFVIYNYSPDIERMCDFWNKVAKGNGFNGMYYIFRYDDRVKISHEHNLYFYQPLAAAWRNHKSIRKIFWKILNYLGYKGIEYYNYDAIWNKIINTAKSHASSNYINGAFVAYDDTSRRGIKGKIVKGSTPAKFECYLSKLIKICLDQRKEYIFLTAWNEWGEGAFLEPDLSNRFNYLEALKKAIEANKYFNHEYWN